MTRLFSALFATLILAICAGQPSAAQNTGGVFGPVVNDGHKSLQYRITIDPDVGSDEAGVAQRLHYQQALDGAFMWRIVGQVRKTADSDIDFDYLQGELFWEITPDDAAFKSGLRFDARYRGDNRAEQFGLNWMNQFEIGDGWNARALVLTAVQSGDNAADGVFLQTRANLYKGLQGGHTIGVELYNSYGNTDSGIGAFKDQGHSFGPFISTPIADGLDLYGGVLIGLSEAAADEELRLWLTKSF